MAIVLDRAWPVEGEWWMVDGGWCIGVRCVERDAEVEIGFWGDVDARLLLVGKR